MKKIFTILFIFINFVSYSQIPKKEVRAIWVATVGKLDWPSSNSMTSQKSELVGIIDNMKKANYNTVVLQIRSRGDLMYPSAIEPWAAALSNSSGVINVSDPGWDPLQFAIDECHKRGMELHAWWNVCNVANGKTAPTQTAGPSHVAKAHPEWCKTDGTNVFLDPGIPEVRTYLVNLAMEMVRKYDIDAIHFDYIRYPGETFDDAATYQKYGDGVYKDDWRRENINKFVRALYDSIMAIKPMMKVGSAPIGNYKAGVPGVGPAWYGYSAVYQDSRRWMLEQKHDYLAPQIYWPLTGSYPYNLILRDWMKNSGPRHIYGGVASYVDSVYSQLSRIIDSNRVIGALGNVFFRYYEKIAKNNFSATKTKYTNPANIPPMPWKDNIPPLAPKNLKIQQVFSTIYKLIWNKPGIASDGDTVKYYNIFRSTSPNFDINDGSNLLYITTTSDTTYQDLYLSVPTQNYYYAVSALDKGNNESSPSNIVSTSMTSVSVINPVAFKLEQNYPNPFNPNTKINYSISERGFVRITIFNILGEIINVPVNENKEIGNYNIEFNASGLASGVYIYRLEYHGSKNFTEMKKMILSK